MNKALTSKRGRILKRPQRWIEESGSISNEELILPNVDENEGMSSDDEHSQEENKNEDSSDNSNEEVEVENEEEAESDRDDDEMANADATADELNKGMFPLISIK